jgi:hypothetical protein
MDRLIQNASEWKEDAQMWSDGGDTAKAVDRLLTSMSILIGVVKAQQVQIDNLIAGRKIAPVDYRKPRIIGEPQ